MNAQGRNRDFPMYRYWQSSVRGLQISNLLLFSFALLHLQHGDKVYFHLQRFD